MVSAVPSLTLGRLICIDSDSDASSIGQAPTNRGKKLKRNARYVHRGRLAGEYGLMLDGAVILTHAHRHLMLMGADCGVRR